MPLPLWGQAILVAVLFYLGAKLSLAFAVLPEVLVMLWIPNSILLAALVRNQGRGYFLFAALTIVAEIVADYPTFSLIEGASFGVINVLEASIAALLLHRRNFDPGFATPNDLAKFVVVGPGIAAFLSACAAASVYTHFRGTETTYLEFLRVWWLGDGLGLLIFTPLILNLWPPRSNRFGKLPKLYWYDGLAIAGSIVIFVLFALSHRQSFQGAVVRPFLLIPLVLYAAARFSKPVTNAVVVAVSALVLFVTKNGQQPFGDVPVREAATSAQELIFVMGIMSFGFAALLSQQRANTRELEERVEQRTAELSSANKQLEHLAITDPLTGVLNRRALFDLMRREMERERRHPRSLAVIVLDIDHFKAVNDRYGHAAGDAVLKHVAGLAYSTVRKADVMARYGGEEFVIMAPETNQPSALQLAERIRSTLEAARIPVDHELLRITASFGVAVLRPGDEEPEQVLQRADQALYAAKAAGRDRVVAADSP